MNGMIDSTKESVSWIKPIKQHEDYWLTNTGAVWSRKRNVWLKPWEYDNEGHLQVNIDGDRPLVHRLVYQHFVGPIKERYVIHHIDNCPFSNLYTNLKAMTKEQHLKLHKTGNKYNLGKTWSQQTKQKLSKIRKGKKFSQEHKQKLKQAWIRRKENENE